MLILIIILCIFLLIYYSIINSKNKLKENFNLNNKISKRCSQMNGYDAISPHICSIGHGDNTLFDFYRNCKCVDGDNGICIDGM